VAIVASLRLAMTEPVSARVCLSRFLFPSLFCVSCPFGLLVLKKHCVLPLLNDFFRCSLWQHGHASASAVRLNLVLGSFARPTSRTPTSCLHNLFWEQQLREEDTISCSSDQRPCNSRWMQVAHAQRKRYKTDETQSIYLLSDTYGQHKHSQDTIIFRSVIPIDTRYNFDTQ
jgi:hypothetical protein